MYTLPTVRHLNRPGPLPTALPLLRINSSNHNKRYHYSNSCINNNSSNLGNLCLKYHSIMDNSIQVHPIIRATVKDSSINNSWLNRLTYKEDHCIISFSSNNSTSNNNNHKFLSITYKLVIMGHRQQHSLETNTAWAMMRQRMTDSGSILL